MSCLIVTETIYWPLGYVDHTSKSHWGAALRGFNVVLMPQRLAQKARTVTIAE